MASSPSSTGRRLLFPPRLPGSPPGVRIRGSTTLSVADAAALLLPAAYDGDVPRFKMLVKRPRKAGKGVEEALAEIKVSSYRYRGHGPLHLAVLTAKTVMCKYLIKDLKLDVNAGGDDGVTPLFFAIYGARSTAITRLLLDHHADPNKAAYDGATPLLVATCEDTYEIAELLLSRRAHADPLSEYGTPLYIAAKHGNVRMLKLLLQHKADPNIVLYTPLKAATCACSFEGMELPIKTGADVGPGTTTPLIAAAYAGSTDCIKCLLEAGADANIPDHNGRMPLEVAAIQGWQESVDVLFPVTTPLVRVTDSSSGEITQHARPSSSKLDVENDGPNFEAQGDNAYYKSDYAQALNHYTMAMEINPDDSTLYAKRSLCLLHTGDKGKALDDAYTYRDMKPELLNPCYAQGAALILVNEYGRAIEELMCALNLDFEREPTAN